MAGSKLILDSDVSEKIRLAIKAKLIEMSTDSGSKNSLDSICEELPDYIMILIANDKTAKQMTDDLSLFLKTETAVFVSWLHNQVISKIKKLTALSKKEESKSGETEKKRGNKKTERDEVKNERKTKDDSSSKKHDRTKNNFEDDLKHHESSRSVSNKKFSNGHSSERDKEQRTKTHEMSKRKNVKSNVELGKSLREDERTKDIKMRDALQFDRSSKVRSSPERMSYRSELHDGDRRVRDRDDQKRPYHHAVSPSTAPTTKSLLGQSLKPNGVSGRKREFDRREEWKEEEVKDYAHSSDTEEGEIDHKSRLSVIGAVRADNGNSSLNGGRRYTTNQQRNNKPPRSMHPSQLLLKAIAESNSDAFKASSHFMDRRGDDEKDEGRARSVSQRKVGGEREIKRVESPIDKHDLRHRLHQRRVVVKKAQKNISTEFGSRSGEEEGKNRINESGDEDLQMMKYAKLMIKVDNNKFDECEETHMIHDDEKERAELDVKKMKKDVSEQHTNDDNLHELALESLLNLKSNMQQQTTANKKKHKKNKKKSKKKGGKLAVKNLDMKSLKRILAALNATESGGVEVEEDASSSPPSAEDSSVENEEDSDIEIQDEKKDVEEAESSSELSDSEVEEVTSDESSGEGEEDGEEEEDPTADVSESDSPNSKQATGGSDVKPKDSKLGQKLSQPTTEVVTDDMENTTVRVVSAQIQVLKETTDKLDTIANSMNKNMSKPAAIIAPVRKRIAPPEPSPHEINAVASVVKTPRTFVTIPTKSMCMYWPNCARGSTCQYLHPTSGASVAPIHAYPPSVPAYSSYRLPYSKSHFSKAPTNAFKWTKPGL